MRIGRWVTEAERTACLNWVRQLAQAWEGECLSSDYVNTGCYLTFRCALGHEWDCGPNGIKQLKDCPECQLIPYLESMRALAVERGG